MSSEIVKVILELAARYWVRRVTIVCLMGITFGVLLARASTNGLTRVTFGGWVMPILVPLVLLVFWMFTTRVPKIPGKKVGVVVAIMSENDESETRLRADCIDHLRKLLLRDGEESNFAIVVYPRWLAERVATAEAATWFLKKSRGRFMVHGRVRTRLVDGEDHHFLELEGVVRHQSEHPQTRKAISSEFRDVLPRRVKMPRANDVFHFEATSEWLEIAARYIIGIAALASGDVRYAERLLLSVETSIDDKRLRIPAVRLVWNNLPKWIEHLYTVWLNHLAELYVRSRDRSDVAALDTVADKLLRRRPNHYSANVSKAMCLFALRRDIVGARRALSNCKSSKDATWRYSKAFLDAYEGRMSQAREEYARAFRATVEDSVPNQCEEFIHLVLAGEPQKVQLHFCSGLINLRAKHDYVGAINDFREFLSRSGDRFAKERSVAEEYVQEAESALRASEGSPVPQIAPNA